MDTPLSTQATQPRTSTAYEVLQWRVVVADGTPRKAPWRILIRWLGGFLLGGVMTLLTAHLVVEGCDLRFCQPFRHEHMHKVRFFQVEVPAVDIVYLGSSQVHFGIMPAVVAAAAAEQGIELGPQYNLGVPGAELEVSYILARDTLKGPRTPRLLILGMMPVLMARDEAAPELVCRYGNISDVSGLVVQGELPAESIVAAGFQGAEVLLQYPFYHLRKPTRAFRWDHLRLSQGCWWLPEDVATTVPPTAEQWGGIFDAFGPPKPLHFDDESRAAKVLCAIRDLAVERDIRLIVVYLPQHPQLFQRKYATGSEERYGAWMTDFCRREAIAYVDHSEPDRYTCDDFMEPMHLNARGAEKLSRRLAAAILTPTAREGVCSGASPP
jgi:hypothetical protein